MKIKVGEFQGFPVYLEFDEKTDKEKLREAVEDLDSLLSS